MLSGGNIFVSSHWRLIFSVTFGICDGFPEAVGVGYAMDVVGADAGVVVDVVACLRCISCSCRSSKGSALPPKSTLIE